MRAEVDRSPARPCRRRRRRSAASARPARRGRSRRAGPAPAAPSPAAASCRAPPKTSSASAREAEVAGRACTRQPVASLSPIDVADVLAPVGRLLEVGRAPRARCRRGRRSGATSAAGEPGSNGTVGGWISGSSSSERSSTAAASAAIFCLSAVGQPAVALVDDQALGGLAGGELLVEHLDDLGRLGALGQERGGVVLGLVGELRAERHHRHEGDDPDREHDPLGAAAGDE